ncbi:hypothetical protein DXG01_006532 [Tephrocybe rancida]|nr:hypothetical protein DXG01_006532 [Tephrocybe rancida]
MLGALELPYTAWWQTGNVVMVATVGLYVQVFYCYRLWFISGRKVLYVLPVGTVILFNYIAACFVTYTLGATKKRSPEMWLAAHLVSSFVGDIMLTSSTAYILLRSQKDVLPNSARALRSLVGLTFKTAAPATVCTLFTLIFSQVYNHNDKLIHIGFNEALPNLFAFSMMWSLNARRAIREEGGFGHTPHSASGSHWTCRLEDVELPTFNHDENTDQD